MDKNTRIPLLNEGISITVDEIGAILDADAAEISNTGTGTIATGAVTINKKYGTIASGTLASATSLTFVLNNSEIHSDSVVMLSRGLESTAVGAMAFTTKTVAEGSLSVVATFASFSGSFHLDFAVFN